MNPTRLSSNSRAPAIAVSGDGERAESRGGGAGDRERAGRVGRERAADRRRVGAPADRVEHVHTYVKAGGLTK